MEKIKDTLPLISVMLLLLGLTRLIMFYGVFHVNIVSFIDLTEVIQLQFSFYIIGLIALVFMSTRFLEMIEKVASDKNMMENLLETASPELEKEEYITSWLSIRSAAITCGLLAAVTAVMGFLYQMYYGYVHVMISDIFIASVLLFVFTAFPLRFKAGVRFIKSLGYESIAVSGFVTIVLMAAVSFYARKAAFDIMVEKPEYEAKFTLADHIVETSRDLIYVGKSKSYVFLYNKNTDQAEIIPTSDIKQMYFKPGVVNHKVPEPYRTRYYKGPK